MNTTATGGVLYVGVVGPGDDATEQECEAARTVGTLVAALGHVPVTGGRNGVMEAACSGAAEAGGLTVGILPGHDRTDANPHLSVAIPTGLGELRNGLVVRCSDVLICIGGSWGTLSEVSLAVRTQVPVVTLGGWDLPAGGPTAAASADHAVEIAVAMATLRSGGD